jgi:hypothetical protein
MKYILYNKKAKLYVLPRFPLVRNLRTMELNKGKPPEERKDEMEEYNGKKLKDYIEYLKPHGGGLYEVPTYNMCVIYEQKGDKPAVTDKVIGVIGIQDANPQ